MEMQSNGRDDEKLPRTFEDTVDWLPDRYSLISLTIIGMWIQFFWKLYSKFIDKLADKLSQRAVDYLTK
jgi:hypothetical protein